MHLRELLVNIIKRFNGETPTKELVRRGMKVGTGFNRQQGCYIDPTHCFLIQIGNNVTFSIRVTVLAHDASTKKCLGFTKIGQVHIGNNVFVGANSTILPNVHIGDNCVIGANSVVTKDIPANTVAVGNPARVISTLEEFTAKNAQLLNERTCFTKAYRFSRSMTEAQKDEIRAATQNGIAFID